MSNYPDTPSPQPDLQRARLPTQYEVLSRQTLAPVDLFSFYIYMRDQKRSVDYLDFWLDVTQHMSLCRHYVSELRRSVLIETPEFEKTGSKRSSSMMDPFNLNDPTARPGTGESRDEKAAGRELSAYLRADGSSKHSHKDSSSTKSASNSFRAGPSGRDPVPHPFANGANNTDSSSPGHQSESPNQTVARADIRASAEKILYTFLIPGSEREIILPPSILNEITEAIEQEGRDDPEVFDAAKDYVFQAMERDAFPDFLRAKALGNLVPPSLMMRVIIGLLAIFGGFWTGFILIFLDKSRSTRCWVILPFTLGVYALASHQYTLDPLLALAGLSEYTFMSFARIREPYVRSLLTKRSIVALLWIVVIAAALNVLFIFVPGKRL